MNKADIIDNHDLTFDPGDKLNGSLYIGNPLNTEAVVDIQQSLAQMRAAAIWSDAEHKNVGEDQRQAYKDQLELAEVTRYRNDNGEFLIARFDHPKFPSSAQRFSEWQNFFDARYTRLG